jgi:DNA-binding response OmpR family regulator
VARILVADDEPDILMVVRVNLEASGHEVLLAADGRMALERIASSSPDLVLLDLMMPVLDGWGVLQALADADDERAVLVLSALGGTRGVERRALGLGAVGVAGKPFGLDGLLVAVNEALALDRPERSRLRERRLADLGRDADGDA